MPEFQAAGGESALSPDKQRRTADVRASPRVDYNGVRALKMEVLRAAFETFRAAEWTRGTARAARLREYLHRERWWIRDYVLYRALGDERRSRPWWEWEPALARRDPRALSRARRELAGECLFHGYVQWLADTQWQEARRAASPVAVLGDVSFMVGGDSADVWANQHAFRLDATVGAPPDAFSETGQDWGLPVYRWDVFAAGHDAWIRDRAARNAALFDGYRIDHVVGFYRTFVIPAGGGEPAFDPLEEPAQLAQGERVLGAFLASGARIIAEDLGVVPDFVRASLRRLGIPGYKVLRWEREWDAPGHPFTDPGEYPASRWRRPAPTTPKPSSSGGKPRRTRSARSSRASRSSRRSWIRERRLRRRHARCPARGAGGVRVGPADAADPGRVRVARPDQRARDGGRGQLDVAAAVARGGPARAAGGPRPGRRAVRVDAAARPLGPPA